MTITDGAAGVDQIQEETIEALSQAGTDVLIEADNAIIMEDLSDNELTGGSGSITINGLTATSSITFNDTADTIRTTSGDIIMTAGSGGITVGHLATGGAAIADPGAISLTTTNAGDISTGSLTVQGVGSGTGTSGTPFVVESLADINSDGDITINGNVNINTDIDVLATGYAQLYSRLYLDANEASGVTTVNGDIAVNVLADATNADTILSGSIISISSYDTSITGALSQSTSLTGSYTGTTENYNDTYINKFNALSHNTTIGAAFTSSITNTSVGPDTTDEISVNINADTGTLTIGGTLDISTDMDAVGTTGYAYSRDIDFDLYGNNVSLQDVDLALDINVADDVTGYYIAFSDREINIEAAQTLTMNSYDSYQTTSVGTTPAYIDVEIWTTDTIISAADVTINGDVNSITTSTYASTGDNEGKLIEQVRLGKNGVTNTMTINGDVNVISTFDINDGTFAEGWVYTDLSQKGNTIVVTGNVEASSIVDVSEVPSSYGYLGAELWNDVALWGNSPSFTANSIKTYATLTTSAGGGMADSYFTIYRLDSTSAYTVNITEGIDVIAEYIATSNTDDSTYANAQAHFNGNEGSVINANYLNVSNTFNSNGFSVHYLETMDLYFSLSNVTLNLTNDLTLLNKIAAGDIYDNWWGLNTGVDMNYAGSAINANNFIIDSNYEANSTEWAAVETEFDTYLSKYINLIGDFVINQQINIADTTDYGSYIQADIQIDDLSGDFRANRILVDSDIIGGTSDSDEIDMAYFDIIAENINIANGIIVDTDINNNTSYGDVYVDVVLNPRNNLTVGGVSTVSGHNNTYEGTARSQLEMYATSGDIDVGDVSVASSQRAYLDLEQLGAGRIDTGILSIDIDASIPPIQGYFMNRRYVEGEINLSGNDIVVDGNINLDMDVDYGSYVSTDGEVGDNEILLAIEGNSFITTGDVTMNSNVYNVAGDFSASADASIDIWTAGDVSMNDINMHAYSNFNNNGEADSYLETYIYPDGKLTIGNIVLDVDAEGTGYTDYIGGIIDTYIESYWNNSTIGKITSTIDVVAPEADYSEGYDYLYVAADGSFSVGNIDKSINVSSGNEVYTYADNYFKTYNGNINTGNFNIINTATSDEPNYSGSENYTYFESAGDLTIGDFTQTKTGTTTSSTPFSISSGIEFYDDISMNAGGNITTGNVAVSSDFSALNAEVTTANGEAYVDISAADSISTGSVSVSESMDVLRADEEITNAVLTMETGTGSIDVNGSVNVSAESEQDTLDDPLQILHSDASGILNATTDVSVSGDFTSHAYNRVDSGAADDIMAQSIAWMMGGYGSGYDLATDLAAGPLAYYPQYTVDKVLGDAATATLGGTMDVRADTIGATNNSVATGAIISSSDDIAFGGTPTVMANGELLQQRTWGQADGGADIASLILLETDPNPPIDPPIDPPTDKPPVVIEYTIPQDYDFSGYSYPKMRTEYVFFDWDSDELDEEALKKLERIYNEYASNGISKLFIEGHTDLSGAEGYNMVLADRRAAAASHMLHALGLDQSLHQVRTLGEEFPYVPTQDGTRLRENRRVKIKYLAVE